MKSYKIVSIRLSTDDYTSVLAAAERKGLLISTFIRDAMFRASGIDTDIERLLIQAKEASKLAKTPKRKIARLKARTEKLLGSLKA